MKIYAALRNRIERNFEILGYFLCRRAVIVVILLLPLIVFLASRIPQLSFESSMEHYLQDNDPTLLAYKKFQNQFGTDKKVIIGVSVEDIFSRPVLDRLAAFQRDLEMQVPHIARVKSLTSEMYIKSQDDNLVFGTVSDLLSSGNDTEFKDFILSSSLYKNRFFSEDRKLAIISLTLACPSVRSDSLDVLSGFLTDDAGQTKKSEKQICSLTNRENRDMVNAIESVRSIYQQDDFQIFVTGMPVLTEFLGTTMKRDVRTFLTLSFVVVVILLYVLFGRFAGVLCPMAIVFCSVSSTFGLMVLMGKPFQPPIRILPSFLVAVGVGANVHIMFVFYRFFNQGLDKREAIARALRHSGLPVVFTCLTTATGLASFSTALVAPVANLGFLATLGVLVSLFYTILLLPVLLAIIPIRHGRAPLFTRYSQTVSVLINRIVTISTGYPRAIVFTCAGLLIISCMGISQLKLVHDPLLRLPEKEPLRLATEKINRQYPGMATVEILVRTDNDRDLTDPATAAKFEKLLQRLENYSTGTIPVYSVSSIHDVVREIHKNLLPGMEAKVPVFSNSSLTAQELLLLESGSPDLLSRLTSTDYQLVRITVQAPWKDAMVYDPFLNGIDTMGREIFGDSGKVTLTGLIPLLSRTIHATIISMVNSYTIALVVISVAMIVLLGHLRLGILTMFPNLLPIFLTLGYMGWAGIPLDMYTLLIGSIALGIIVDDTIHFMYNFRRYYEETGDVADAVQMTLETCGLAMLVTTIVLACGSFIFMASAMKNLFYFGMLTGMTIILALLADFFLAPALMTLYYRQRK